MKILAVFTVLQTVGLALLAGCSASDGWVKPGMTPEGLNQDTASCLLDSSMVVPSREGPRRAVDQDRYRRCMADRGYTSGPSN